MDGSCGEFQSFWGARRDKVHGAIHPWQTMPTKRESRRADGLLLLSERERTRAKC